MCHIRILCLGLMLFFVQKLDSQPILFQKPLSSRVANYDIDVKLDPAKRLLHGKEVLTWYNKSQDTITELQFHLYLNAFRNTKSTFMKESGGIYRNFKLDKDGWGYIEVDRINLLSGENLTGAMEFIQPDDDNDDDKTVFRLPLAKPILPGRSIILNLDFTARLPEPPIARTGAKKEYFFIGQWFPKIGVYLDGKWNCHQFHANSEFFADFGVYDVRITVPEKNIVGATGVEVEVKQNGDGTATHYYHAEDVHDFAWTTSPEFIEVTGKAQDVDIRILIQPDHTSQNQRHLDAAKVAIEYFQNWYGDYPYPNLTVVDPRRGAMMSGGMEYPTLITAATFYGLPAGIRLVEAVIIHEFGHNYWYGMVASNEFEEAWLDEGINSYSECQIFQDQYGPIGDLIAILDLKINGFQINRGRYIAMSDTDPIVRNSWEFYSGSNYGINVYYKTALALTTLQNYLGKEVMQQIMRTYFERWKFKHPTTRDFINVANEISGQDLNWFFDQALFSTVKLDYSVAKVLTKRVRKNDGYDFAFSVSENDTNIIDNNMDSTVATSVSDSVFEHQLISSSVEAEPTDSIEAKKEQQMYFSEVKIRRPGDFKFPVEVEMEFENGEKIREKWNGEDSWKKFHYIKPTKLRSAAVDPDNKILLDINYTNNSRAVEKQSLGVNKLAIRFLFWMQFLLDQPEFLNLFSGLKTDL